VTTNERAPITAAIAALSGDAILRFLAKQRWFAAKGASPTSARVASVVVMPWGNGEFAIARVTVSASDGDHEYQVPLALDRLRSDEGSGPSRPEASVVLSENGVTLYDAVYDEAFRQGIASALAVGTTVTGADGLRWIAEPVGAVSIDRDAPSRVGAAEQSNTSIVFDDAAIYKLFRTLNTGVHPDVE
jgi:maltokinase